MTVKELAALIEGEIVTRGGQDNEILCGCACDLLSWVMAKGAKGCAWVTVQTHMNVIAVASLHEMAVVICPEGIEPESASVAKADEEGIAVLSTAMSSYRVSGILCAEGIPDSNEVR